MDEQPVAVTVTAGVRAERGTATHCACGQELDPRSTSPACRECQREVGREVVEAIRQYGGLT